MPGHPISIKGTLFNVSNATDQDVLGFTLRRYGILEQSQVASFATCPNSGPVFNPLEELIYGKTPNPYADPTRGALPFSPLTAERALADPATARQSFEADKFLQNITGKDSIIGKAIRISFTSPDG